MKLHHNYHVYILRCSDGSYYTGFSGFLEKRIQEHEQGTFPKCYTFYRRPVVLVYCERFQFVQDAIMREKQIKRWSRGKKEALIAGNIEELVRLAKGRGNPAEELEL